MSAFTTKDYSTLQTAKKKRAVGMLLGRGVNGTATNAEVGEALEQYLRTISKQLDRAVYDAGFVGDPTD